MTGGSAVRQHWPEVDKHEDLCRVLMFRWRLAHPAQANDHERFPCSCVEPTPWTLREIAHPAWCVLGNEPHPWHQCTITRMVPVDKE